MAALLKGEMTRHILKCYPAGKEQDKRPIPNELSMLIFYLQAHRSKISKAARMLQERASYYMYKNKPGNFLVTALIMQEMIEKLSMDFTLFEEEALAIVQMLVNKSTNGDSELLQTSQELFMEYNDHNRGVRFLGHPSYCQQFLNVISSYSQIASSSNVQCRIISLKALGSLAKSRSLETSTGKNGVVEAMQGILSNLPQEPEAYSRYSVPGSDEIIASKNTAKTPALERVTSRSPDDLVTREAVAGLRAFLDTTAHGPTGRVIECLLQWLSTLKATTQPQLLATIVKWVPPQNRFLVTKDLVLAMYNLPVQNVKQQFVYSDYLDALLKSDVAKIDLSVMDMLQCLMYLQRRLIDSPPANVDSAQIQSLVEKLRGNIGNLAGVHVYPGQCGDMVNDILSKYSILVHTTPGSTPDLDAKRVRDGEAVFGHVLGNGNASGPNGNAYAPNGYANGAANGSNGAAATTAAAAATATAVTTGSVTDSTGPKSLTSMEQVAGKSQERSLGVIVNDMRDLHEVLIRASASHDRQRMNLTVWEGTQWLLSVKHPQPLTLYVQGFAKFLQLAHTALDPSTKRGSYFFRQLCRMLQLDNMLPTNYIAIYYCMISQIDFFGPKSHFLLPWLIRVIPGTSASVATNNDRVYRTSVILAALLAVFRSKQREEPASVLFEFIQAKVGNKRWLPGITFPLTAPPEEVIANITNSNLDFGAGEDDLPSLDLLGLTEEELAHINNPGFEIDTPLDPEELRAGKGRPSSVSGGRGMRSASTQSNAQSISDSQTPRVGELRRRQTEILSLRSEGRLKNQKSQVFAQTPRNTPRDTPRETPKIKNTTKTAAPAPVPAPVAQPPQPANNEHILSLLKNVNIDSGPRGNLTV